MKVEVAVSLGELIDKITILKIKREKIQDLSKQEWIKREEDILMERLRGLAIEDIDSYMLRLKEVNLRLWAIEDKIRLKESLKDFGEEFIELARAVYKVNDQRFAIKNEINNLFGSEIKEVKSYQFY